MQSMKSKFAERLAVIIKVIYVHFGKSKEKHVNHAIGVFQHINISHSTSTILKEI